MESTNWFIDRVLPGIVLATIFGLLTVYVAVTGLTESTREYRESTGKYRAQRQDTVSNITEYTLNNRERIIVLEAKEECVKCGEK